MKQFNVKMLYIYKLISQCLPIYAFYTILFIERGQSVRDIAVLIAIWSVFSIVFEIPSGVLADRWNRRNMLVIATVLQGLCFVVWYFSHTFMMFAIGFVLWAIAGAFESGTEEGLIYDNLKSDGCEDTFSQVYGKTRFYANVGTIVGIASAGIIASFIRIEVMALLSAAICFINVLFAVQIRERNFYSEQLEEEAIPFLQTLKEAGTFIKKSPIALLTIVFLVFFASLGAYLDEFDALIVNDFQLSKIWVSGILTVRFVFVGLGDILAPKVQKRISSIKQIVLLSGLASIILMIFAILWQPYLIPIFGIFALIMAITEILLVDILQNEIKEEGRSTVMSFYGAGQNVVMICFSLLYGYLTELITLQQVYMAIAGYGMIGGFIYYILCIMLRRG